MVRSCRGALAEYDTSSSIEQGRGEAYQSHKKNSQIESTHDQDQLLRVRVLGSRGIRVDSRDGVFLIALRERSRRCVLDGVGSLRGC